MKCKLVKKQVFLLKYKKAKIKFNNKCYTLKPKNNVRYQGVIVNVLNIYNYKFANALVIKKSKRKLDMFFNYLVTYIDDGDEEGNTDLRHAFNSLTRFKSIINSKYRNFLEAKYIELLLKKIETLEAELKTKVMTDEMYYNMLMGYEDTYENINEETIGKSR